jgi:hypothetical protein
MFNHSAAGVSAAPLLAEYGAAKSFVTTFSKALNCEYSSYNIHVQCQVALFVATKLAKIKNSSLFVGTLQFNSVFSPYTVLYGGCFPCYFWVISFLLQHPQADMPALPLPPSVTKRLFRRFGLTLCKYG